MVNVPLPSCSTVSTQAAAAPRTVVAVSLAGLTQGGRTWYSDTIKVARGYAVAEHALLADIVDSQCLGRATGAVHGLDRLCLRVVEQTKRVAVASGA